MNDERPKFAPEAVAYTCPRCHTPQTVRMRRIVDSADGDAVGDLLSGRLTSVACPSCGARGPIPAALLFHDQKSESALVLVPSTDAPRDAQEKEIGRLTNRLLDALPPEARRMYLLQPRTFLSLESFLDAVLEASGVPREELEASKAVGRFVERLLRATSDSAFDALMAEENRPSDAQLLAALRGLAAEAEAEGGPGAGQMKVALQRLEARAGPAPLTFSEVLTALEQADAAGHLDEVVSQLRPALDYRFFLSMTAHLEAAGDDGPKIEALRGRVLAALDRVDDEAKQEIEQAVATLQEILTAPDRPAAVRDRGADLSPSFFLVLQANLEAARKDGRTELVAALEAIRGEAVVAAEAAMPPRERMVNRLARATTEADRRRIMAEAPGEVDADFREMLLSAAQRLKEAGAAEAAANLEAAAQVVATTPATSPA